MAKIKVMTVFGTRPEAIKMAPVVLELKKQADVFETTVVVTAQHREMLDQILTTFEIKPDYDLNIMGKEQTLADITTNVLTKLDPIIKENKPDIVLVHGDTSTTFVASLAAFYNQVKVGHVEAGLRTHNKYSPFPEEVNRQLTGIIADIHFAPTEEAKENLLIENKKRETIYVTGNTVIDALKTTVSRERVMTKTDKRTILVTVHRRENLGENMRQIFSSIKRIVQTHKDVEVVYPMHLNPKVRELAKEILGQEDRIKLIEPLDVVDFHNLIAESYLVMTDSGGLQEEAPSFGVPVNVLRDTTERPEGVTAGTLKLAGTNESEIFKLTNELLTNQVMYQQMSEAKNPYGDGKASQRIAKIIKESFKS